MTRQSILSAMLACGVCIVATARAADAPSQWRLVGADTTQGDEFGFANDIDGDTVVVGASYSDSSVGFRSGTAYVFVRNGAAWPQQHELVAFDRSANAQFGASVGVSGDTVIVGALEDGQAGPSAGAAYVFARSGTTWAQLQKLVASDATSGDEFGESAAIDGGTAVVGARYHPSAGSGSGAAYVFARTGTGGTSWSEQQKLAPGDGAPGDNFGVTVAVDGDTVVVGAPYGGPSHSGAAYVFARSGAAWSLKQKLEQSGPPQDQAFGYHVAISGDTILVGAPDRDDGTTATGAAYVFVRAGGVWSQQQRLVASDAGPHDRFGRAVSVSGDTAVLSSPRNDAVADEAGAVYVFVRSNSSWSQLRKITAVDAAAGDKFGLFVSLSGDVAVAGAPLHGVPAQDAGSAYILEGVTGAPGPDTGAVDSFILPQKITVKNNVSAGTTTIAATGIFDTGPVPTTLGGAARLDIGPIDIAVPSLVRRGRNLTFAGDGVKFTLTPGASGSSKATFKLNYRGVRATGMPLDGQVALRFRLSTVKGSAIVNLAGGRFVLGKTPGGLVEPSIFVVRAGAVLRGAGRDSLSTTVGFASGGAAPANPPQDLTMTFGAATFTLTGSQFAPAGNVLKFVGDVGGIKRVVLDNPMGTLSVTGTRLTLGDYASGGNAVPITVRIGNDERGVQIRMGRKGAKLTY